MARQLRKKIQSIISEEDLLEIELQDYVRLKIKDVVENQKERRKYLYRIFEDDEVNDFIKNRQIDEAKDYIDNLIRGLYFVFLFPLVVYAAVLLQQHLFRHFSKYSHTISGNF